MGNRKNIKLVLQYDGTNYQGWQRQKGVLTLQETLEDKLRLMTGEAVKLIASGRTDAGVHALGQVCHFVTQTRIAPGSIQKGLNSLLPEDIYVREAEYAPLDFHSRYSAKSKTYEYRVLNREDPDIFLRGYTWHISTGLDLASMHRCMATLKGRHDFSSFRSSGSGNTDAVREMIRAELHGHEKGILLFVFEADGFLRHMVRNIVGTMVRVGQRKMGFEEFLETFGSMDRRRAGVKAPAQGLFLIGVHYGRD